MTLERREAVTAIANLGRSEEVVGDVKDIRGKQSAFKQNLRIRVQSLGMLEKVKTFDGERVLKQK